MDPPLPRVSEPMDFDDVIASYQQVRTFTIADAQAILCDQMQKGDGSCQPSLRVASV